MYFLQERWLQEAIKENIESCDNSMSSLNDVMDDEETQKLRGKKQPDSTGDKISYIQYPFIGPSKMFHVTPNYFKHLCLG